jgi:hypothetical protein
MQGAVIVRCPKCETERIISPRYGEIIAVYCLCQTEESHRYRYPTRMDILPAEAHEPAGAREPVTV